MLAAISNSLYDTVSSTTRLRLDRPENMLRKVTKVAIPAIFLFGTQAIQGASAIGCVGCVICLGGGGGPLCVPICVVCGVTITVPLG